MWQGKVRFDRVSVGRFLFPLLFCLVFVFSSCSPKGGQFAATHPDNMTRESGSFATAIAIPTATTTPAPTSTPLRLTSMPVPTRTEASVRICTPLEGVPLSELPQRIVNPFNPPKPGSDDPHQGVDLADRLNGNSIALEGLPVQIVQDGLVAGVIVDRFPYGNALLVETPLEDLPVSWVSGLDLPAPIPSLPPNPALTCPPFGETIFMDTEQRSLYLLYAHLKEPVNLEINDEVGCDQSIGAIGQSGNALNPHLHIEVRLGPSGLRIPSMAHYDTSATAEEMGIYCLWRVSGVFQLVDPLRILGIIDQGNSSKELTEQY